MTTADGSMASVPTNGELFSLNTVVVRHFLPADVPVTRHPFIFQDGSNVPTEEMKALFNSLRELDELKEAMQYAVHTKSQKDMVSHPVLTNIGSLLFYGAAERNWDSASTLFGPIWFGRGVTIRVSAKIIGPSLIDDYAFINTAAKITRSILGQKTQIEEDATIKDAIIGSNVWVCAGARLSSRCEDDPRHEKEVMTHVIGKSIFEEPIPTGRRKMGPIVGDGCVIGANAVLMPGVILFPGYKVSAGRVMDAGIYYPE
jgi:NDP-sugar pyrophosphorylase family protein